MFLESCKLYIVKETLQSEKKFKQECLDRLSVIGPVPGADLWNGVFGTVRVTDFPFQSAPLRIFGPVWTFPTLNENDYYFIDKLFAHIKWQDQTTGLSYHLYTIHSFV